MFEEAINLYSVMQKSLYLHRFSEYLRENQLRAMIYQVYRRFVNKFVNLSI
jgi:hypothetical protein